MSVRCAGANPTKRLRPGRNPYGSPRTRATREAGIQDGAGERPADPRPQGYIRSRSDRFRGRGGPMGELTDLLLRANSGDEAARQQLFASAYQELRVQARARLREGGRNTLLDTTALVHES